MAAKALGKQIIPNSRFFVSIHSKFCQAKTTNEVNKSWAEFFKMVGIEALTASDAQKKNNIDIRTEQIARGLQAAEEQGFGEWAIKVAGRSFV